MLNNKKKYAFETVDDPSTRYNFDLMSKELDQLRSDYDRFNYAVSSTSAADTPIETLYPSFSEVPQLNKTFVTTGKAVLVGLQPGAGQHDQFTGNILMSSTYDAACTGHIRFLRDGLTIWETPLGMYDQVAVPAGPPVGLVRNFFFPASQFWTIDDQCPAGKHVYKVTACIDGANSLLAFNTVRLILLEWNGKSSFLR